MQTLFNFRSLKLHLGTLALLAVALPLAATGACNTVAPAVDDDESADSDGGDGDGASCPAGFDPCNGFCVDLVQNSTSCGTCGNACATGSFCAASTCTCQAGLNACTTGCADVLSDGLNCGVCGTACAAGTVCSLGACAASCAEGLTQCGASCVDTNNNVAHCGACDSPCMNGTTCSGGVCSCPAGQTCDEGTIIPEGTGGGGGDGDGDITDPTENGGYISSVNWFGYAFTSAYGSATIAPADFGHVNAFGPNMCADGTVPASMTGEHGAMIGWSINQAPEDGEPALAVVPTLEGISYNISNPGGSQLRMQIQGPNGSTDAADRWCVNIGTGGEGYVAFDTFEHECWPGAENPGEFWNGEPISQVLVMVPASSTTPTNFDFCIEELYESTSDGMSAGEGCALGVGLNGPTSGSMNISGGNLQRHFANNGSPRYAIQNNMFNPQSGANVVDWNGNSFTISQQGQSSPNNTPVGYPSLFIGSSGGDGLGTSGSNLPIAVSSLVSVPTAWKWTAPASGKYNVAYDVWFSPGGPDAGPGSRSFLMVWFHRTGGALAEGEGEGHVAGSPLTLGDKTFDVYVSDQFEGRPVISYVAKSMITEWSFDLMTFINDAKSRSSSWGGPVVTNGMSLTNIFGGFEIWNGSQGIKTDGFCVNVNP